ncbi:MAG: hypothetical protein LLG04_18305 [Parachlamydia sp.]|nr:hypothetical protein [Parachlamydia sp.]
MADYLIITSSGGGGHKIAADAIQQKKAQMYPTNRFDQLDVMRSGCSYGSRIGKNCTDSWDNAQQRGDVKKQLQLVRMQPVAEALFCLGTFFTVLRRLLQGEKLPKKVICTQPLHLLAITEAVRVANLIRFKEKRKITKVDLYLTDLPTSKAEHFFGALRRLHFISKRNFKMVRVHAPEPICLDGQTSQQFWKSQAHLQPHQIKIEAMPVSAQYKNPASLPMPGSAFVSDIKLFSNDEKAEMEKLNMPDGRCSISENDKVGLLMLGSVPERFAILGYVDGIAAAARESALEESGPNHYFFIACGSKEQNGGADGLNNDSLYKAVCKQIRDAKLPRRVKIVPFIGQPVAPIFGRSDLSITRSGGMTSAEILALKSRKGDNKRVLIHAPLKKVLEGTQEEKRKQLMACIPLWENGNADYLVQSPKVAAEVVNPKLAQAEFKVFFK